MCVCVCVCVMIKLHITAHPALNYSSFHTTRIDPPYGGVCVCVLLVNLSGPNQSAVADPVRGLLDSRGKSKQPKTKRKTQFYRKIPKTER